MVHYMIFAVRAFNRDQIKTQLSSELKLQLECITCSSTKYSGIALLEVEENIEYSIGTIRNIEALLLDEVEAAAIQ